MMEAICSSETSVLAISTWRNIPEDGILHTSSVLMTDMRMIDKIRENLTGRTNITNRKTVQSAEPGKFQSVFLSTQDPLYEQNLSMTPLQWVL
jgi:hypothetical protein